jgi:fluoroquinolone transport system permease protein
MFKRLLKHELKNITKDKMYLFLAVFPIIMAVIAYFLIPYLKEQSTDVAANIVVLVFILLNGFMFGAITAFTLLDDSDDKVLLSLRITPISVKYYVLLKLIISYIFGIFATIILLLVTNFIETSNVLDMIYIIILAPLQGPIFALLINSLATNKVEGFVIMKLSGIILMIPIAALFLTKWTELLLGVIPGFWVSRIISMQLINQDYFLGSTTIYFFFGLIVHLVIGYLLFKLYQKKVNI